MIIDALIFLATLVLSPLYAAAYFLISLGKMIVIIFKPVIFVFSFLYALIVGLFTQQVPASSVWTPDGSAVTFFQTIPYMTAITSMLVMALMIGVTINAFRHEK